MKPSGPGEAFFFMDFNISHISCLSGIELVKSSVCCGGVVTQLVLSWLVEDTMRVVFGGRLRIVSMRSLAESLKLHSHDWGGRIKWYQSTGFRYPLVRSACRLTLPTDESSVKTILLKLRWIDLSSSSFIPYLYSILFLPLRVLESSLLSAFLSLGFRVGWTLSFLLS